MSSTEIVKSFRKTTPGPLLELYGPYTDLAAACANVPNTADESGVNYRRGMVVGVLESGKVVDYWWPGPDYSDSGLIRYDPTHGTISVDDEGNFVIMDSDGYIGMLLSKFGELKISIIDLVNAIRLSNPSGTSLIQQSIDGLFSVADPNGYLAFKIGSDGTIYMSSAKLREILLGDNTVKQSVDGLFSIADKNGFIGLKLDANGQLRVSGVKLDKLQLGNSSLIDDAAYVLACADPNGNLVYAITKLSELIIKNISASGTVKAKSLIISDSFSLPPSVKVPFSYGTPSDYILVIGYGQSNSLGGGVQTVITGTQKYDSLMPRGRLPVVIGGDYGDFVPLIEQTSETPMSAAFEKMIETLRDENFSGYAKKGFQLIGTTPGLGDTNIANLSKGSVPYTRLIENVTKCNELAKSKGGSFTVPFIFWTHGEKDAGENTSYDSYYAALNQLIIDLNTDILAITGQKNNIPLIGDQVCWNNVGDLDRSRVSKALLDVSLANPYFVVACPSYFFDYDIQSETIHFSAKYRRIYGAYLAIAAKRTIVDGIKFKPLMPISFIVTGNNLQVIYNVPVGSLKIDTTTVSDPGNYGIQVYSSTGTLLTLSNIKIISRDTVSIDCSASPAGGTYSYARNARAGAANNLPNPDGVTARLPARGCLRDTQGDTVIFDSVPLHNWAVASYLTIN